MAIAHGTPQTQIALTANTEAHSAAFATGTRRVRFVADVDVRYLIGTDAEAAATSHLLREGVERVLEVCPGQRLSVYPAADGLLDVAELS